MKHIHLLTFLLVVIGAVNWLLFGLMGVNLITVIFGGVDVLVKLIYFVTGLAGLHMLTYYKTFVK